MSITFTKGPLSFNPFQGSSPGAVQETYRVNQTDSTQPQLKAIDAYGDSECPQRGDALTGYTGYRVVSVNFTEVDKHILDCVVTYSNKTEWLDRTSSSPQDIDRQSAGYINIVTSTGIKFVDIWHVNSAAQAFWSNDGTTDDPGHCGGTGNVSTASSTGNVDSAGEPISWPVIFDDVTVSFTRDVSVTGQRIPWATIASCIGKRNNADWLGFAKAKLVFIGGRVVETFGNSLVNFEMRFQAEQFYHLRQRIERRADGGAVVTTTGTNIHAAEVYAYQPFLNPTAFGDASSGGLLTTGEYSKLLPKKTTTS